MTDSEDHTSTRPISVAELLARNGSIGAPPVGGRRRRRRGNTDSVTVAELTGEIPIITDDAPAPRVQPTPEPEPAPEPEPEPEPATNGIAPHADTVEPIDEVEAAAATEVDEVDVDAQPDSEIADTAEAHEVEEIDEAVTAEPVTAAEQDYEAFLELRDADDAPVEFAPPPRRPQVATPPRFSAPAGGAEGMSPDPLGDVDDDRPELDLNSLDFDTDTDDEALDDESTADGVPSYLRSSADTLFGGGQSVADDLARRKAAPTPEDIDLGEDPRRDGDEIDAEAHTGSAFLRGVWVVVQCILAVAFGAGLFIAFDLLWKWNTIVALVLAVLVILGLVAGVRVVRRTEDIASTLIAVAVGALVAFGPLALLQSH